MPPPAGFPLFSVPKLVLMEIFKEILPSELVCLSLCSKKAYLLVNLHYNKSIIWEPVVIPGGDSPRTSFAFDQFMQSFSLIGAQEISKMAGIDKRKIKTINIGGHLVPSYMKREHLRGAECLVTYWVDQRLGMRIIIDYSSKLFNNYEISTVLMGKNDFYIIDYLMSRRKSVPDVTFNGHTETVTDDQYLYFLRNAIVTKHLAIAPSPPENFQYSGTFQSIRTLVLGFGFWVTLDNLMAMNSNVIMIRGSKLISSEFNRYLKNWISRGGSSAIKYLSVEVKSLDLNVVFKDLENQVELVEKRRQYTWMEEGVLEFGHSYDLTRRDDNVTATVYQAVGHDGTRMFEMVVWPDFYGKWF